MISSILSLMMQSQEIDLRRNIATMLEVPDIKKSWVRRNETWVKIKTPERTAWWKAMYAYRDSRNPRKSQLLIEILNMTKEKRDYKWSVDLLASIRFDWQAGAEINSVFLLYPPKWTTLDDWKDFLITGLVPEKRRFIDTTVRKHWARYPERIKIINEVLKPFDWERFKKGLQVTPPS